MLKGLSSTTSFFKSFSLEFLDERAGGMTLTEAELGN